VFHGIFNQQLISLAGLKLSSGFLFSRSLPQFPYSRTFAFFSDLQACQLCPFLHGTSHRTFHFLTFPLFSLGGVVRQG
jgi:hypothetical protein